VPRQAFNAGRQVHQPLVDRVRVHQLTQLRDLLYRLGDRQVVRGARGNELGEPVHFAGWDLEHAADVAHRRARLHGPEGDDLSHAVSAVPFAHVLDDFPAAFEAEVDVDVGHRHPLRIQEPLEEQVEPERIDVGNAQRDATREPAAGRGSCWTRGRGLHGRNPQQSGSIRRTPRCDD
jgi:hypothetical protein